MKTHIVSVHDEKKKSNAMHVGIIHIEKLNTHVYFHEG